MESVGFLSTGDPGDPRWVVVKGYGSTGAFSVPAALVCMLLSLLSPVPSFGAGPPALSSPGARALTLPYPIVEREPFAVRVGWRLPVGISSTTLHVELKDARSQGLQFHVAPIRGSGTMTVSFTAPALTATPSVQIVVWTGTDWQKPLTPLWFSPQIWVESRQDAARAADHRPAWEADARGLFRQHSEYAPASTAAVLDDPALSAAGHREARVVSGALKAAGYHVLPVNADRVVNPFILNRKRIGLLALTDAGRLPVNLGPSLEAFLHDGGSLVVLGAPAWREAMERISLPPAAARLLNRPAGLAWIDTFEYDRVTGHIPASHLLSAFASGKLEGWTQNINPGGAPGSYMMLTGSGHPVLHALIPHLTGWDTYRCPPLQAPFAAGETLTSFRARGDSHTPRLAVEWDERDGSRWIATVPLTAQWQTYSLEPGAFQFWPGAPQRGGPGDHFHPENAQRVSFGLAFTHTGQTPGRYEWWVSDVGPARNPLGAFDRPTVPRIPPADGLFPGYRFFQSHDVARIAVARSTNGTLAASDALETVFRVSKPSQAPAVATYSLQPRPTGDGFRKNRPWRFVPLLEARGPHGEWRGIPAALVLHTDDEYQGGAWLSCAMRDPAFYESPRVMAFLTKQFQAMKRGVFLQEAGSNYYTYFPGQAITLGARVVNLGAAPATVRLRVEMVPPGTRTGPLPFSRDWTIHLNPGESLVRSAVWQPTGKVVPASEILGKAEITLRVGVSTDTLSHEVGVWQPRARPQWITAGSGQFWLNGRPWKVHGVNYMPSSGIGQDDPALFEQWLSSQAYDPAIVERDLEQIRALGFNAVSIFQYHESAPTQNLLDVLRRCRNLGLHADVSLRPGEPLHFLWPEIEDIIRFYRLSQNDTVFAYDIAWEPSLGDQKARTEWDPLWRSWILDRYGSFSAAEREWGFPAPRAGGAITNPPTEQLYQDGPWKRLALAYRRFADELVARAYEQARLLVKSADPHHLVSFRMTETSNPTFNWAGTLAFDFAGVAPAVDFLAPEAYGRIGGWEQVKPGWFERAYARWAAPDKPMDWKEMGNSVWDNERMGDDPVKLGDQANFFQAFYRMMEQSGSNGIFYWWYPGGFRVGENSDFGILNPDGTNRPATTVIRKNAAGFLAAPMPPAPSVWITFDPNQRGTGVYGVYQDHQAEFWNLVAGGRQPGLRTPGTGTTSANCPAIAVGGGPWTGQNPPQYLDGLVFGPGTPTNPPGCVLVLNTGEAAWLRGQSPQDRGSVWLVVDTADGKEQYVPLPYDILKLGTAALRLPPGTPVRLYLEDAGRGRISSVWRAGR